MTSAALRIENFAQIESASMPLQDLVVLVGPQATGKSLVLQLLKLARDRTRVVGTLKRHGFTWTEPAQFASLFFGGGFERSWRETTRIELAGEALTLDRAAGSRSRTGEDAVFYIPAHRTLTIAEGWPRPFLQYQVETPFVARRFSEQLLELLNLGLGGKAGRVFPPDGRLKAAFKQSIDDAVFHGAELRLETTGLRRQFVLDYEQARLPFMTWTAGQREFIPLLLGLYRLLTAGKETKKPGVEWVIIEEPEMGLHPKAVVSVMGAILELLHRGYRVALSTHSPTVLEILWAMNRLRGADTGGARLMSELFQLPKRKHVLATMRSALNATTAVVYMEHGGDGKVRSVDISELSPGSEHEAESGWGGLTQFSARVSRVVSKAATKR